MRIFLISLPLILACGGFTETLIPEETPVASPPVPTPAQTYNPSFDCQKATTPTERRICESEQLSSLDRDLALAWKTARMAFPDRVEQLKSSQRVWLKGNEACMDEACIVARYRERIQFLKELQSLGTGYSGNYRCKADYKCLNSVTVLQGEKKINFHIFAAWQGLNPENIHIGEAEGEAPLQGSKASWSNGEGCSFTFSFGSNTLELEQVGSDGDCGFGANVYAGGSYIKGD